MKDKIEEVKLAILDRILSNITDKEKSLTTDTIVAFSGIVESFDKTEEYKNTPKSDPNLFYKHLIDLAEEKDKTQKSIKEPEQAEAL